MTILKLFCATTLILFEPHTTLSSPFHVILCPVFKNLIFTVFFRANHGLRSLQEGLHWVDRHGGQQEPNPHPGSALQVHYHQAKLWFDIEYRPFLNLKWYILHSHPHLGSALQVPYIKQDCVVVPTTSGLILKTTFS